MTTTCFSIQWTFRMSPKSCNQPYTCIAKYVIQTKCKYVHVVYSFITRSKRSLFRITNSLYVEIRIASCALALNNEEGAWVYLLYALLLLLNTIKVYYYTLNKTCVQYFYIYNFLFKYSNSKYFFHKSKLVLNSVFIDTLNEMHMSAIVAYIYCQGVYTVSSCLLMTRNSVTGVYLVKY